MLGYVVGPGVVGKIPVAGKDLAQDRVQGLLDSPADRLVGPRAIGVINVSLTGGECASR